MRPLRYQVTCQRARKARIVANHAAIRLLDTANIDSFTQKRKFASSHTKSFGSGHAQPRTRIHRPGTTLARAPHLRSLRAVTHPIPVLLEQLAALSQSGLAYTQSEYDRDRYESLRRITAQLHSALVHSALVHSALADTSSNDGAPTAEDHFERLYPREIGYRTPKVDVRGIVFRDDRILLVHEKTDGRWSVPGGWADIGESPAENVVKEIREESGYHARVLRLLALLDRSRHGHGQFPWCTYKVYFSCEVEGEPVESSMETQGVGFFKLDDLPELSTGRITATLIRRFYEMHTSAELGAWFD